MAEYYLISQLPSLDGLGENAPLPITEERFLELCHRFLGKKVLDDLKRLTLVPSIEAESSCSALMKTWNESERNLRLALAKVRSEKLNKPYEFSQKNFSAELLKVANAAVEIQNPLEAEQFLLRYRLNLLETLRPMDTFSEEFVFYYGLKLKLIMRIKQFDTKLGEATYKDIYNSILNGDGLEVK